jgi:hypothetical protein
MGSYLSGRAGCLYRQTAGSWDVLDTLRNMCESGTALGNGGFRSRKWRLARLLAAFIWSVHYHHHMNHAFLADLSSAIYRLFATSTYASLIGRLDPLLRHFLTT